ncbi:MAG: hypothetical protein ACH350_03215 [Parachlamydiaceae bacterium]
MTKTKKIVAWCLFFVMIWGVEIYADVGEELTAAPGDPLSIGAYIDGVAYSPNVNGKLFLATANDISHSFSIFQIPSDTFIPKQISGSPFNLGNSIYPSAVAFSPIIGENLFLALAEDGKHRVYVYKVDPNTDELYTVSGSPYSSGGNYPWAVVYSPLLPNGKLFLAVTNVYSNNVVFFNVDTLTGQLTKILDAPFPDRPEGIAFSPIVNGQLFFSVVTLDKPKCYVSSVNTETGALSSVPGSPYTVGKTPSDVAFSPLVNDHLFLAVANRDSNNLSVFKVETTTGELAEISTSPFITGGNGPCAISYSPMIQNQLFLSSGDGSSNKISCFRIDTNTGDNLGRSTYSVGKSPYSLSYSSIFNGRLFLAIGNQASKNVSLFQDTNLPGISIAAGCFHSLELRSDGNVWAWGNNSYGQLGNGNNTNFNYPVQVIGGLKDVTSISAGSYHSMALKKDGTVWTWGLNNKGQLGIGSTSNANTPTQIVNFQNIIAIAGGGEFSLALDKDGNVWAWGDNSLGQVGVNVNNVKSTYSTPQKVLNLSGVIAIAAGQYHALALKNDGKVYAWGANGSGQLGNNSTTNQYQPVATNLLTSIKAIAAGSEHSLALKSDEKVYAWGNNFSGQLGNGNTTNQWQPVLVQGGLSNVAFIAAGGYHSLAIKSDGTECAWGNNSSGELGDGSFTNSLFPKSINGTFSLTAGGCSHSLALGIGGDAWAWGSNSYGQLGAGLPVGSSSKYNTPQFVLFVPPPQNVTVTQTKEYSVQRAKIPFARYIDTLRWRAPEFGDNEVMAFRLINRKTQKMIREIQNSQGKRRFAMKIRTNDSSRIFKYALVSVGRNGEISSSVRPKIMKIK